MKIEEISAKLWRRVLRMRFGPTPDFDGFARHGYSVDDAGGMTPIEKIFWGNKGRIVHKWHHYLPLYDRYFATFRNRPIRFLEIGVCKGGSLDMWRNYFGPEAIIFGVDIDPNCAEFDGKSAAVRIGSQADAGFLNRVVDEMGGVDIVLDDGSHQNAHIRKSFDALFPRLSEGGIYVIEDLHTAYWWTHGGGYRYSGNFLETIKTIIDDMHHWYHSRGQKIPAARDAVKGIHIHDSLVVLEKGAVSKPFHSKVGNSE